MILHIKVKIIINSSLLVNEAPYSLHKPEENAEDRWQESTKELFNITGPTSDIRHRVKQSKYSVQSTGEEANWCYWPSGRMFF